MKYDETSHDSKKFSTGLIITIALALLIVAGAAWFALSRYNSDNPLDDAVSDIKSDMGSLYSRIESSVDSATSEIKSDISSVTSEISSDINSEYHDITSSYNDTKPNNSAAPTGDNVSSVPFEASAFTKPAEGDILKDFSATQLQYSKTYGDMRLHSGIDIACKNGTSISACADGKVLSVEESQTLGTVVTIDHGNDITAKYCSIENLKIKKGDSVKAGDIIGTSATVPCECNDEEHIHFEVYKDGVAVSPFKTLGLE